MRHVVLDEWALRDGPLHRLHPKPKAILLLLALLMIGWQPWPMLLIVALLLVASRLPLGPLLLRSAAILPFAGVFALMTYLSGDTHRALQLFLKSWTSALAVLLVAATTPLPRLLDALRSFGVPPMLLDVIQYIYRYLFLLGEQSHRMRLAAQSRGASASALAAAGTIAVLFARSYQRAEGIERAILSRK